MDNVTILRIDTGQAVRSVNDLRQNIKILKTQLGELEIGSEQYQKTLGKLVTNQNALRGAMSGTAASMGEVTTAAYGTGESYNGLVNQMAAYRREMRSIDISNDAGKKRFAELAASINGINNRLKEMDAATGNYQRNVGNYEGAVRGLNIATAQIMRELPSLTMSFDMFFLAISNNIPMLVDQIGLLREESAKLQAQGKQGINVFQQVAKSFLSWNTVLSVGITLLTVFGGRIVEWVKGLFSGKEAADAVSEATENYNAALDKIAQSEVEATASATTYYGVATDVTRSMEDRLGAAQELIKAYPQYLSDFEAEEIAAGKAVEAYDALRDSLMEAARSKAAMQAITENYTKILEIERKQMDVNNRIAEEQANIDRQNANLAISANNNAFVSREKSQKAIEDLTEDLKEYQAQIEQLEAYNENLRINITFTASVDSGGASAAPLATDIQGEIAAGFEDIDLTDEIDKFNQQLREGLMSGGEMREMARNAAQANADSQLEQLQRVTQQQMKLNEVTVQDESQRAAQRYAIQMESYQQRLTLLQQFEEQARQLSDPEAALQYSQQIADTEVAIEVAKYAEMNRLSAEYYKSEEDRRKNSLAVMQGLSGGISSILTSVADAYEASAGDSEEAAERVKGIRIASATIDTIAGAIGAYMQASATIPPPAGQIIGAIQAAAVTAAGIAQIQQIRNTDVSGGSSSSPSSGSMSATVAAPTLDTDIPTVRNLTGLSEEDRLNRMADDQRVYILSSDIEASQNGRRVRVRESSF